MALYSSSIVCKRCNKRGHIAKYCRSTISNKRKKDEPSEDEDEKSGSHDDDDDEEGKTVKRKKTHANLASAYVASINAAVGLDSNSEEAIPLARKENMKTRALLLRKEAKELRKTNACLLARVRQLEGREDDEDNWMQDQRLDEDLCYKLDA